MDLILGVDTDGILIDMYDYNVINGKDFFKREPINPYGYDVKEMFACSEAEEFKYGLAKFVKYCKYCPPRVGVVSTLKSFKESNMEIHNITARKFVTERNVVGAYSRKLYESWLNKNDINFDSIEYCSESNSPRDKYIACRKLGVDIMIEDKPEVALYLAEKGIKVLLFNAPYNYDLHHKNIVRVNSWQEIKEYIFNIKKDSLACNEFCKKDKEEITKMNIPEKKMYFKSYHKFLASQHVKGNLKLNIKWFKALYCLGKFPIKLIYRTLVIGKENIPYQDGLILASNHVNNYDQFLISDALGMRYFSGMAASTIKDTFRGKLFQRIGAEFVDRQDPNSKKVASENLAIKLANGVSSLIFPEGTRKNKDTKGKKKLILDFHIGTVAIAQKTGSPIIPLAIEYGKKYSVVRVGKPFHVLPSDNLDEANDKLKGIITDMVLENKKQILLTRKVLKKINR